MTKTELPPIAYTNKQTSYLFAGFGVGIMLVWAVSAWLGWIPRDGMPLVLWMLAVTAVGAVGLVVAGFVMDARFQRNDPER